MTVVVKAKIMLLIDFKCCFSTIIWTFLWPAHLWQQGQSVRHVPVIIVLSRCRTLSIPFLRTARVTWLSISFMVTNIRLGCRVTSMHQSRDLNTLISNNPTDLQRHVQQETNFCQTYCANMENPGLATGTSANWSLWKDPVSQAWPDLVGQSRGCRVLDSVAL